jgi:hypothetical protein
MTKLINTDERCSREIFFVLESTNQHPFKTTQWMRWNGEGGRGGLGGKRVYW